MNENESNGLVVATVAVAAFVAVILVVIALSFAAMFDGADGAKPNAVSPLGWSCNGCFQ